VGKRGDELHGGGGGKRQRRGKGIVLSRYAKEWKVREGREETRNHLCGGGGRLAQENRRDGTEREKRAKGEIEYTSKVRQAYDVNSTQGRKTGVLGGN